MDLAEIINELRRELETLDHAVESLEALEAIRRGRHRLPPDTPHEPETKVPRRGKKKSAADAGVE